MSANSLKLLFERCPDQVKSDLKTLHFGPEDVILEQGALNKFACILTSGTAKVIHTTESGIPLHFDTYGPWEMFGELELFQHQPAFCSVLALRNCEVIQIPEPSFFAWLESDFRFSLFMMDRLAGKMLHMGHLALIHVAYPLEYRLLYFLQQEMNARNGSITQTKQTLCEKLGTSPRSLNRVIRSLSAKGIISYKNGVLHMDSPSLLAAEITTFSKK